MAEVTDLRESPAELLNPAVIAAFTVARRAGRLPGRTLASLVDEWEAELIAKLDMEDFYDLAIVRPHVRYKNDERIIDWPEAHIYLARPSGATRDLLLVLAQEPNFQWRQFVDTLGEYLNSLGARMLVTLRAFPGYAPHTRALPVVLNGSDSETAALFGAYPSGSKYEGPTDVGSVLSAKVESLGWKAVDLSVLQPFYFPRMPNLSGSVALIDALDRGFGLSTPVESLREAAQSQIEAVDAGLEESDEIRTMVSELEKRYDAGFDFGDSQQQNEPTDAGELPSAEELIQEVENIFRSSAGDSETE